MAARRTDEPFAAEVRRMLDADGRSLRTLAGQVGVDPSFLSRVLRSANYKSPSVELCRQVALAFGLAEDYFPEYRLGTLVDRIKADPALRDRLYAKHAAAPRQ